MEWISELTSQIFFIVFRKEILFNGLNIYEDFFNATNLVSRINISKQPRFVLTLSLYMYCTRNNACVLLLICMLVCVTHTFKCIRRHLRT
jgi:hypothetical protein